MPETQQNFSKIVRSLLLDMDVHLDQLEQIGYLSKVQRGFLDKFLYKSEDALRAANLVRGCRGTDLLVTKSSSNGEGSSNLMQSPSRSKDDISNVTSRVPPRLRSVTEQLKSEENSLTTFLQRCNARNFSVKVKGTDIGKESPNKGKGSDYILTLEPIAESIAKSDGNNLKAKLDNKKSMERVESIDYETTVPADAFTKVSLYEMGNAPNSSVDMEPDEVNSLYTKAVEFEAAAANATTIEPALKLTKVEPTNMEQATLRDAESKPANTRITKINPTDAGSVKEQWDSQSNGKWSPMPETVEEMETNVWGKPTKPDLARNEEAATSRAKAKSLGVDSKGRTIMEKMGWSRDTGLGKQKEGVLEPITLVVKNKKAGLRTSDEEKRKSRPNHWSSENVSAPTLDPVTEDNPVKSENLPGSRALIPSDLDRRLDKPDRNGSPELVAKVEAPAKMLVTEKYMESNKPEADTLTAKPQSVGIKALYLREGDSPDLERSISFKTRIQSTDKYKTTMHRPGVIIRAMSPQSIHYSRSADDIGFNVCAGSVLEVLRVHQGDEYHVYNFRTKRRGIVKISLLEMMDEHEAAKADVAPFPNIAAATTCRT